MDAVTLAAANAAAAKKYARADLGAATIDGLDTYPDQYPGILNLSGLMALYDPDTLGLADGAAVASWTNATGSGVNALAQATGSAQPILKKSQVNGHAVVRFSGSQYLRLASMSPSNPASMTIVIAAKLGAGTNKFLIATSSVAQGSPSILVGALGQLRSSNTDLAAAGANSGWAVYRVEFVTGGSTCKVHRNGRFVGEATVGSGLVEITMGAQAGGAPTFFGDADVALCAVINRGLTPDEKAAVDREFGNRIGATTRSSIGTVARSRSQVTMTSSNKASISVPESYVPGRPTPVLLVSHGNGANDTAIFDQAMMTVTDIAVSMGLIVAMSDGGGTANIGNATQRTAENELLAWVQANYTVGRVVLGAMSAGGLSSLKHILIDKTPNVVGWIGLYPATNLADAQTTWASGALFTTAYGTYSTAEDPNAYAASAFGALRYRAYASSGDTTVNKTNNADALIAKLTAGGSPVREAAVVACTGNHGDTSHFQPRDAAAFIRRCLA